jgi:hypothetical protein
VPDITPVLLRRFSGASADELREAHGYAYGGAIIQDMGYYPFGSKFYSEITHYVRSGEFVMTLLRDAADIKEYAFAIGSLSHYWADNSGHPIATNVSVPILYPKLKREFGSNVTYEQNPLAHIQTEFGFDVLQVAQGHYASDEYHHFIGFMVAKPLLERAFKETYGLDLATLFTNIDLSIGTHRHTVSTLIPTFTRVAWESNKREMEKKELVLPETAAAESAKVLTPARVPTLSRQTEGRYPRARRLARGLGAALAEPASPSTPAHAELECLQRSVRPPIRAGNWRPAREAKRSSERSPMREPLRCDREPSNLLPYLCGVRSRSRTSDFRRV